MTDVLKQLVAVCGDANARAAGAADTVGGVPARWVVAPASTSELAGAVAVAAEAGLTIVPRGGCTKLDWGGSPARVDLVVDTARLTGLHEHTAGDLVATVGAGTPLRAVQAVLATAGQRIALDPASRLGTLGGVLSTGEAGPLRLAYGTPRDLLIGVEFVRADGVVAHSGGRVVKNVAGYDVGKLLCGSYATLGVIASATLRLHPLPAAQAWVLRPVRSPVEVDDLVGALLTSTLVPAAVEVDLPGTGVVDQGPAPREASGAGTLAVLLEGSPAGVAARAAAAVTLLAPGAAVVDRPPSWWGRYPFDAADVALKLVAPIAELPAGVAALRDVARAAVPVRGSAGTGVVHAALAGDWPVDRVDAVVTATRAALAARGGSCTVVSAPAGIRDDLDLWGEVPGLALMRRVKEQFDPAGTLAPGRAAGGL